MSKPCGHTHVSVRDCKDCRIAELEAENAKLRGLMSEALSNMEYYPASLGEHGLVQDRDITAMQEALQERGE